MSYSRKSYAYDSTGKQVCFDGHIRKETAQKRGFTSVTLTVIDRSGKGRGENRHYYAPDFESMCSFY